ncbi:hypothetical protein C8R44DRAFT_876937 [Mycena epipterygia]|nr:hypothetical protein C8R44DRAFT_876937 [Mycena epipterygia]
MFKQNTFFKSEVGAIYFANELNELTGVHVLGGPPGMKLVFQLQQEVKMNSAFRIHVFAGDLRMMKHALDRFAAFLNLPASFFNHHRASTNNIHIANPLFTFLTIVWTHWYSWEIDDLPSPLRLYRLKVYGDALFNHRVPEAETDTLLHHKFCVAMQQGAIVATGLICGRDRGAQRGRLVRPERLFLLDVWRYPRRSRNP